MQTDQDRKGLHASRRFWEYQFSLRSLWLALSVLSVVAAAAAGAFGTVLGTVTRGALLLSVLALAASAFFAFLAVAYGFVLKMFSK